VTPPADLPPTNGSRPGGVPGGRPPGRREAGDPAVFSRRLDTVEQRLEKMVANLDKVARAVNVRNGTEPPEPLDGWFLQKDPDTALSRARELADWVEAVWLHYPKSDLPPCWAWHPAVVEELLVAFELWREAFITKPSWSSAGDWHEKTRPGVARRLAEAEVANCEIKRHQEGGDRADRAPAAPLRSALDVIAQMWAVNRETPYPTVQDVNEARHLSNLPPL
jgi:hypothetical protein